MSTLTRPMSVVVIIPTYNRPQRLREAVLSVLAQDLELPFDLVVVDDASTESLADCCDLVHEAGHQWIRHERNMGPAAARNTGVLASPEHCQWITFLDSDDLWQPSKLSSQLQWHAANPEFRISQVTEQWTRKGVSVNKPVHLAQPDTGMIFPTCLERCAIGPSCVAIRRDLWQQTGGFNPFYRVCEDYELWLRIADRETVGLVDSPQPLVEKRGGFPDQLSVATPALDRYRLAALADYLRSDQVPDIESRNLVVDKLRQKAAILAKGAMKRERSEWADFFTSLTSIEHSPLESQVEKIRRYCD